MSTKADACPNCGASNAPGWFRAARVIAVVFVAALGVAFALGVLAMMGPKPNIDGLAADIAAEIGRSSP